MERNWKVDPGEPSPQARSIRSAARQSSISSDGVGPLDSIEAPASSTLTPKLDIELL
jgi:hypothetical protein